MSSGVASLAAEARDVGRRNRGEWTMLAALSLASVLVVFDDAAVAVALPSLQRGLGLGAGGLEWTPNS